MHPILMMSVESNFRFELLLWSGALMPRTVVCELNDFIRESADIDLEIRILRINMTFCDFC